MSDESRKYPTIAEFGPKSGKLRAGSPLADFGPKPRSKAVADYAPKPRNRAVADYASPGGTSGRLSPIKR